MEQFYFLIPTGLFFTSFIVRCFIIVGFWEIINVGRTMLLEAASMVFITSIHFSIEVKKLKHLTQYFEKNGIKCPDEIGKAFLPTIKVSDEPFHVWIIAFVFVVLYFVTSFS